MVLSITLRPPPVQSTAGPPASTKVPRKSGHPDTAGGRASLPVPHLLHSAPDQQQQQQQHHHSQHRSRGPLPHAAVAAGAATASAPSTSLAPGPAPTQDNSHSRASPRPPFNPRLRQQAKQWLPERTPQAEEEDLPAELWKLLDASAPVNMPPPSAHSHTRRTLSSKRLDKLITQLGRNKATWRRALLLYEWLKDSGHSGVMDARLCTSLIRVCGQQRDAVAALSVYEWMRAPAAAGGAGLQPTVYTYTETMRAALSTNYLDKCMQVWQDACSSSTRPDSHLCITYMEMCVRLGMTERALAMYARMRSAPADSPMAPSAHAFTMAMKAACEAGLWPRALEVWEEMKTAGCQPTAHAYTAAISACAGACDWPRAMCLFKEMTAAGVRPDVVSCTALMKALASTGEVDKAEAVVLWMRKEGMAPNVHAYTVLMSAMGNARQWNRAVELLYKMQLPEWGQVQPNAFTYSVLIKLLGDHGQWQLAEAVFGHAEQVALRAKVVGPPPLPLAPPPPPPRAGRERPAAGTEAAAGAAEEEGSGGSPRWARSSQLNGISLDLTQQPQPQQQQQQQQGGGSSAATAFSLYSSPSPSSSSPAAGGLSPASANVMQRPSHHSHTPAPAPPARPSASLQQGRSPRPPLASPADPLHQQQQSPGPEGHEIVNNVVCGALMHAYEQAGMWAEAVGVLGRAQALGLQPNNVMCNTAIASAGKAGQIKLCEQLFGMIQKPDVVTFETMITAYGYCGLPEGAEVMFQRMVEARYKPRDYAYCGLIAAYTMVGNTERALSVRHRAKRGGGGDGAEQPLSVSVYNALLAACERGRRTDAALQLLAEMKRLGLEPNAVTSQLMSEVGRQGVESVEGQQVALAAISAAVAAAGGILIQRGMF